MSAKKYHVTLSDDQRIRLERLIGSSRTSIRQRMHARVLLAADTNRPGGALADRLISKQARTTEMTVFRLRRRFAEEGFESCLHRKTQTNRKRRSLDGAGEAQLIALVCGAPPEGHKRWSLMLLRDRLIAGGYVDSISHETVRQTLKKMRLSLG